MDEQRFKDEKRFKDMEFELGAAYSRISHLERLVTLDELTGLGNRRGLNSHLGRALAMADRQQTDLTFIAIDLDKFKKVNDTFGHFAGDTVLKGVAEAIQKAIRSGDYAFRQGGEEFSVIAQTTFRGSALLAEKIRVAVEGIYESDDEIPCFVSVSLGVSMARVGEVSDALVQRADEALYRAKRKGRNRVELG